MNKQCLKFLRSFYATSVFFFRAISAKLDKTIKEAISLLHVKIDRRESWFIFDWTSNSDRIQHFFPLRISLKIDYIGIKTYLFDSSSKHLCGTYREIARNFIFYSFYLQKRKCISYIIYRLTILFLVTNFILLYFQAGVASENSCSVRKKSEPLRNTYTV